jgi:hypothetical protein
MICAISLLIFVMFATATNIPSNVVQYVFLREIDKCIYPFDLLIVKARLIYPTLI